MNKGTEIENKIICIPGDYTELYKIRKFIEQKAKEFGFTEEDVYKITLAVDEACTNLIEHAYKLDKTKELCIDVESNSNEFIVNITDKSSPFNPLEAAKPDMKEYVKKYSKGGLGIFIMRSVMDEISYIPSTSNQQKNILKLKKILH